MYVIKHVKTGKYCKFGSYKKVTLYDEAYKASLYITESQANIRLKTGRYWVEGKEEGREAVTLVKIKITVKEVQGG
jgi:hypothetical protein